MKNLNKLFFAALTGILFLQSCKKDDDLIDVPAPIVNEQEVITTLQVIFTDSATNTPAGIFQFRDTDGDGPNGPVEWDTIALNNNTTYYADVVLLNELASPIDSISNEVAEEANDHQFFFTISGANLTHSYLDQDTNTPPLPIGLHNKIRTGNASNGSVQIILKHQPGIKDGLITTGDTDIDVTFVTNIQ
jgi:hypothetical protein